MGDPLKKVQAGDALQIPHQAYNAFVDAARAHRAHGMGSARQHRPHLTNNGIVKVYNMTGTQFERFDHVGIHGVNILPAVNPDEFYSNWSLAVTAPSPNFHPGKFVVLLEPLEPYGIAHACVDGVCPCKVNITDETHQFAETTGFAQYLESAETGSAQILWKAGGSGIQEALIRFPFSQPSGVTVHKLYPQAEFHFNSTPFTAPGNGSTVQDISGPWVALEPKLPPAAYYLSGGNLNILAEARHSDAYSGAHLVALELYFDWRDAAGTYTASTRIADIKARGTPGSNSGTLNKLRGYKLCFSEAVFASSGPIEEVRARMKVFSYNNGATANYFATLSGFGPWNRFYAIAVQDLA